MGAVMGFNAEEAVNSFNRAVAENDQLNQALLNAGKRVEEAFGGSGAAIGSDLGKLMENVWGDGSETYFKVKLSRETEFFLLNKVRPIIERQEMFVNKTSRDYYNTTNEPK